MRRIALALALLLAPIAAQAQSNGVNTSGAGILPVVAANATSLVALNKPGNLYGVYATNNTNVALMVLVFNSITVPADGTVAPVDCIPLPAAGNARISYGGMPPAAYTVGISIAISTATTCVTKTTNVADTALIRAVVNNAQ